MERLAALDPDLRKLAVLADPVGDARTGGESPASLAVETDHVAPRAHEYPTVLRAGADRESGFGNRERAAGGRLLGDDSEPAGAVAGGDREAVSVALNDDRVGTGEPRDRLVAVGVVHEGGVVGLDQDDDAPPVGPRAVAAFGHSAVACEHAESFGHVAGLPRSPI